jgi:hypothetical protein
VLIDAGQRLGDAVDERFAADEADIAMGPRLGDEMLAAAEADLEPDFPRREREQRGAIADRRWIDLEPRQAFFDQRSMIGPQRLAAAAPVERAPRRILVDARARLIGVRLRTDQETRPRNELARSVFSQEKPPSASGLRPKWP